METSTGTSRSTAAVQASSPHGYQSTGLSACWRRYGLVSAARRLGMRGTVATADGAPAIPPHAGWVRARARAPIRPPERSKGSYGHRATVAPPIDRRGERHG